MIGRYEVLRLLGQGGMGRVWLACDTVLGRGVAIKVLRDDLALPPWVRDELLVRMRHEARAAAAVSHPNIVTLHDMGEDNAVGLFLVFEYVRGPESHDSSTSDQDGPESLRDRLRTGPLPLVEVARLARELGSALSFAHEAGVIHRDIKPENILFCRTGAKIADFGIARIPESTITRQNTVLGTPAYTAPEALAKGEFSAASDQFALAATLYEAATGVRAFGSDDPLVTVGHVASDPPAPVDARIGSPAIARALTKVFDRGLAKNPTRRFSSCAELGDAVAHAIEWPSLENDPPAEPLRPELPGINIDGVEMDRRPLSSRVAHAERIQRTNERPIIAETPVRLTLYTRKRTERAQNIAAAAAVLVIVALFLWGRKTRDDSLARQDAASDASASAPPSPAVAGTSHKPHTPVRSGSVTDASPPDAEAPKEDTGSPEHASPASSLHDD